MTDLTEVEQGDIVDAQLAVRRVDGLSSFDGGHLLRLELGNASGSLPAKLWLGPDGDRAQDVADEFQAGDVLDVAAPVQAYQGRLELSLEAVPPRATDVDPDQLVPSTDAHVGRRVHRCLTAARSIEHPELRRVAVHVWTDEATRRELTRAPATKRRHRSQLGGFVEHVTCELALAERLAELHEGIDRDLLVAGVLVHDLGRLDAYEAETAVEMTREGRLLGTAALADTRLEQAIEACEVSHEVALHLRHMALSHAGRARWGAPVEPATPEAIALHAVERLDTRVAHALEVAEERRERDQLSGYSSQLNGHLDLRRPADPEPPGTAFS